MKDKKINLTDHAKEMLLERLHVPEHKMQKIALKAWKATDIPPDSEIPSVRHYAENGKFEYRKLMGQIFVFSLETCNLINLITVYPPTIKKAHKSSKLGAYRAKSVMKKYVI
jgi:hypothetical protein